MQIVMDVYGLQDQGNRLDPSRSPEESSGLAQSSSPFRHCVQIAGSGACFSLRLDVSQRVFRAADQAFKVRVNFLPRRAGMRHGLCFWRQLPRMDSIGASPMRPLNGPVLRIDLFA
jgi:hypothetical protein